MEDLEPPPPPPPALFDEEEEENTVGDDGFEYPYYRHKQPTQNDQDTTPQSHMPEVPSEFDVIPDANAKATPPQTDINPEEPQQTADHLGTSYDNADVPVVDAPGNEAPQPETIDAQDTPQEPTEPAPEVADQGNVAAVVNAIDRYGDDANNDEEANNDTLIEAQRLAGAYVDPNSPTSEHDEGVTPTMSEDAAVYMCGRGFDSYVPCEEEDARSPANESSCGCNDVEVGSPVDGSRQESPRNAADVPTPTEGNSAKDDEDEGEVRDVDADDIDADDIDADEYNRTDDPSSYGDRNATDGSAVEEEGATPLHAERSHTEQGSFVDVSVLDQARRNMLEADENPEGDDFVVLPEGDRPVRIKEYEEFATKVIGNLDRLQEDHIELSSNIQDAIQNLEVGFTQKIDDDVSLACTNVTQTLKTDYMNHLSALRQYFDTKIDEVVERGDEPVASNVKSVLTFVDGKIAASEYKTEEAYNREIDALKAANAALEERVQVVQRNMDVVSAALHKACQLEQLLEPRPIPEGPKVRIMVRLAVCTDQNPPPMMLVPISKNASISDLKHECIRRARQQKAVQDTVVYSKTAIAFEGVSLFDDDTFDDIGLQGGENVSLVYTGAEATVVRLQQQQLENSHSSASLASPVNHGRPGPPPMMGLGGSTVSRTSAPPPAHSEFRVPDRPSRPNTSGGSDVLAGFFLDEELSKDIADREQLDRRLMTEVERMERDPLKAQETMCRVRVAKDAMSRVRAALLDKATYSHSEVHRAAARSTLTRMDNSAYNPSATVDDIISLTRQAEVVINGLATNAGEDNRIDALAEAAARNQARKDRLKEELEEAAYELRHKVRVPYDMMPSCEKLLDDVDRAAILSQTMSADELDDMLGSVMAFINSMKNRSRA